MKRSLIASFVALTLMCTASGQPSQYRYLTLQSSSVGATSALAHRFALSRIATICVTRHGGRLIGRPNASVIKTGRIYSATVFGTCQYAA